MYGNRDPRDIAVTRFYTSQGVYDRLYTINEFENSLRSAFESGAHEQGVIFIQADAAGRVRPCAPNKILFSDVVSLRPNGFYLPTDFDTRSNTAMKSNQSKITSHVPQKNVDKRTYFDISEAAALDIIDACEQCFVLTDDSFEWEAMRGLLKYFTRRDAGYSGRIVALAETGRRLDREKSGDKSGLSILGTTLRTVVSDASRNEPVLVLLQQQGGRDLHWSGGPFWWPILAAPGTGEPCVFATKVAT
jgi:hypothetical protein